MIPILYSGSETDFTSNGICRLTDIVSGVVTEERNGIYECEFKYPITGEHYFDIQEGCIIACWHDDTHTIQPFEIYGRSAPLNDLVTFYAHHISYRLGKICLKPMSSKSCLEAFSKFQTGTINSNPFTFWTDKSVEADFKMGVPISAKEALGGIEGSILDIYGPGEYEWDKFMVKFHSNRGQDRGVSIRYGKNLTKLKHDTDHSEMYNAVAPYWKSTDSDGNDILVTLPEWYITNFPVDVAGRNLLPMTKTNGTWPKHRRYSSSDLTLEWYLTKDDASGWFNVNGYFDNSSSTGYGENAYVLWSNTDLGWDSIIDDNATISLELTGTFLENANYYVRVSYIKPNGTSTSTTVYLKYIHSIYRTTLPIKEITKIAFCPVYPKNTRDEFDFSFRIKIEKGTRATPWSPAPEDTPQPVWTDENGNEITDENNKPIEFNNYSSDLEVVPMDLSDRFDSQPSVDALRALAKVILSRTETFVPKETIDVDFEQIWESEEYENYAALQRVSLCDKVDVVNPEMNLLKIKMEVVSTKYNFVKESYDQMTLGTPKTNFSQAVTEATEALIQDLPNKSFMQAAIDYATKLIQGGLGGHVVFNVNANGEPEEILIMDTDSINTAVNVWRFNLGGLGHSHSGYNGPFSDVALTMDGRINANMITAGILDAGIIRAGILMDALGNNWWNLDTGEFHTSYYVDKEGVIAAINASEEGVSILGSKIDLTGKTININSTDGGAIQFGINETKTANLDTGYIGGFGNMRHYGNGVRWRGNLPISIQSSDVMMDSNTVTSGNIQYMARVSVNDAAEVDMEVASVDWSGAIGIEGTCAKITLSRNGIFIALPTGSGTLTTADIDGYTALVLN